VPGVIFVGSVRRSLQMPELSATPVGLMAISRGSHLGFEFPEQGGKGEDGGDHRILAARLLSSLDSVS
jgi:hypothetical protein